MYARRLRLSKSGGNATIIIPRELMRLLGLSVGTDFDVHCHSGQMIIDLTSAERSKLLDPPAEVPEKEPVEG
jgi:antitoxin component of MazEF toxin-antitoxin module